MTTTRASFPEGGRGWNELQQAMRATSSGDIDWKRGRSPLFVFLNDAETYEIGRKAYFEYFSENALGGSRAFFGIGKMERDVIDYGLSLFSAPDDATGVFTNGGSESIFLAVKAARDAHRARVGSTGSMNIVMPDTAHAAFDKAANAMDLEIRRASLRADKRVDVEAMEQLVDGNTVLLVGSAPCYPHGVIDPIEEISSLAVRLNIWMHVDACVGGWIAPFFTRIGRPTAPFDFRYPGVRSISADLHKFGFCPKPASTVFYRSLEDQQRATFVCDQWPSGVFRTATLSGTRPAGAIAAAWAVLNHLGTSGYERAAHNLASMVDAYVDDINGIPELEFWAKPEVSIINFGSKELDIFEVAEGMAARGWLPALTRRPKGLHLMMSLFHEPVRDEFIADLRASVADVKRGSTGTPKIEATYS
ncbi:pyridoxal phosphate-dependent decarboxylase family protein [Tianweitania sediminis]|uniref:Aspartate aminotransferase family protein n=1 Tax=Tianweitania sediminis TaxID=1502156 RepID=A0A8J7RMV2_9HYPH|nr:aspartate aminotransferase family protein [Tianweitania sediminis]